MENLLQETIKIIEEHGKNVESVKWCGTKEVHFEWEEFKMLADIEYDSGYGSPDVATDLLIVGEDWWLERHEYDGSEWWEFKEMPKQPNEPKTPNKLIGGMWDSLAEINKWE